MSDVNVWLLIIVMAFGTFLLRLSFIQFGNHVNDLPDAVGEVLELIPVAVLAALAFPQLFVPNGSKIQILYNTYLLTGVLAGVVAWRSESLLLTIVFGLGLLWVLQNAGVLLEVLTIII